MVERGQIFAKDNGELLIRPDKPLNPGEAVVFYAKDWRVISFSKRAPIVSRHNPTPKFGHPLDNLAGVRVVFIRNRNRLNKAYYWGREQDYKSHQ